MDNSSSSGNRLLSVEQWNNNAKVYDFKSLANSKWSPKDKVIDANSTTLGRYIERFRTNQPMSRNEREAAQAIRKEDFWWLQDEKDRVSPNVSEPESVETSERSESSVINSPTYDDITRRMQDKADELLTKIPKSSYTGTPSDSGQTLSPEKQLEKQDDCRIPPETVALPSAPLSKFKAVSDVIKQADKVSTDKEDILTAWRLKHKLELARKGEDPLTPSPSAYRTLSDREPPPVPPASAAGLAALKARLGMVKTEVSDADIQMSPNESPSPTSVQTSVQPAIMITAEPQIEDKDKEKTLIVIEKSDMCIQTDQLQEGRKTVRRKKKKKTKKSMSTAIQQTEPMSAPEPEHKEATPRESVDSLGFVSDIDLTNLRSSMDPLPQQQELEMWKSEPVVEPELEDEIQINLQSQDSDTEFLDDDVLLMLRAKRHRFRHYLETVEQLLLATELELI